MDKAGAAAPCCRRTARSKGPGLSAITDNFAQARVDMFESGLFGQGAAFWRWVLTEAAAPYVAAFAADRRAPVLGEPCQFSSSAEDMLDPDRLAELARQIEATYG